MFEYKTFIRLYDTDAAGVLFFARQLYLVHDAYEAFLESGGLSIAQVLNKEPFVIPVVHAQTNFQAPLKVGDRLTIKLRLKRLGTTSYTISHHLYNEKNIPAGEGETVHICLDKKSKEKIPLPPVLIRLLKTIQPQ